MAKKATKAEAPVLPDVKATPMTDERRQIEILDATYGKGKGFIYKHDEEKGEARYIYEEAGATKCRVDGTWYVAVFYRNTKTKMMTSTTAERWKLRFKRDY